MNKIFLISLLFLFLSHSRVYGGEFLGDLILYPENCQKTDSRICKLGAVLTYKSSRNKLVWQTDKWKGDEFESGTTDGASIPKWAWPIIGDPYDESYLKAAIIHDHYCYEENHVRSWRDTHLMFYEALKDLKVEPIKAKTMYFAVYLFGPHWVNIVPGEDCGQDCIKILFRTAIKKYKNNRLFSELKFANNRYIKWEGDRLSHEISQNEIEKFRKKIEKTPDLTIEDIQKYAEEVEPNYFFFKHGDSYSPKGKNDINILPHM